MMEAKTQKRAQKKFRHLKDENPIFFVETFDYNNKTHYIMSSSSTLYIGYMEKVFFNQVINYSTTSYVVSYCLFQDSLYLGLKNGCIIFVSLEHAYNSIPYKKVESVDGKGILGISVSKSENSKDIQIYTISEGSSFKLYRQFEEGFKLAKSIQIDKKVLKVVSNRQLLEQNAPSFMVWLKEYEGYPILLTQKQVDRLLQKLIDLSQILMMREKKYFQDQRLCSTLTTMDFDPIKLIATIGYINGVIEVLKIQQTSEEGNSLFIMTPELRVQQRESIVALSIISDPLCPYIGFVSEINFSGINYDSKSTPFAKTRIDKGKQITVIKWTKDKYFIAASVSNEDKKRIPKIYCIEQNIPDDL